MELVENELYVYCSDSLLIEQIRKLVFIEEAGEQKFSMNQLLPLPSGYSDVSNCRIFGHHWREVVWGVCQDGNEFNKYISNNRFHVYFTTPWMSVLCWLDTFINMSERLYENIGITPKPEVVIFFAYGIFDTRMQGFLLWEPGGELEIHDTFQENWRSRLNQVFKEKRFDYYWGEVWN